MGNREDLLAGARRCLEERGWARTTVRDISAAAGGVSMAAIGYHFGSREELLTAALIEAMIEWSEQVAAAFASADDPNATPAERFEARWAQTIASITQRRTLWLANLEALLQAEHTPALRERLVAAQRDGRRGLAAQLLGADEDAVADHDVRAVGSVQLALLFGVMAQWLNDPPHAPRAADLLAGLHAVVAALDATRPTGPTETGQ